jgi:hypothetical protein
MSATAPHYASGEEMLALARQLWGEPNKEYSTLDDIRFGSRGSKSVKPKDLVWYDNETGEGGGFIDLRRRVEGNQPNPNPKPNGNGAGKGKRFNIVARYPYRAANGQLAFEVVRLAPKDFRQRRPGPNGKWIWKLDSVERVPYQLPELIAADPEAFVFIPEGEKDVNVLNAAKLVATTNPGGASKNGKWRPSYNQYLRGRHVVVLPDNDEVGRDHAADIAGNLDPIAASVRILKLPGLPPKGDVSDWLAAGNSAAQLVQLAEATPLHRRAANSNPRPISPVDELLAEFNGKYMVVNDAGRAVVFQETVDPVLRRRYFLRIGFEDFGRLYLNRTVQVAPKIDDKPAEYAKAATVWLNHRQRRQYINGVVFDPTNKNVPSDTLNLWRGFAIIPREGSWSRMQDHLLNVVCSGDTILCDYVLNWSARLVQFPAEQGEVAIVMRGTEGCGKGTFARALLQLLGQHGLAISNPKHLTGAFNGHLRDCVYLFGDECFFAGDKAHVGVLKAIITEPTLTIEGKYQNAVECPNFLHVILASNNDWVVPASIDSRRWFVLNVPDTRVGDTNYFVELYGEMANGGREAMLYDLLNRDISKFNPRTVPMTEGLMEQRKLSLPVPEAWWLDVLHRGYVFNSKLGLSHFGEWHAEVATELLFASYSEFSRQNRDRHPLSREAFGRFMHQTAKATPKRLHNAVTGERVADVENPYGGMSRVSQTISTIRPPGYQIGDLELARAQFEAETGLTIDWPKDEADG